MGPKSSLAWVADLREEIETAMAEVFSRATQEAFQRGVERGMFEQRMKDLADKEATKAAEVPKSL